MQDDFAARQASRMAMVGKLARPVQHDINNMLTVVFANLDMLKRVATEGAPQRQLDRVVQASRRMEDMLRAMLSFTRREPGAVQEPLAAAMKALVPLLQVLLPAPGALAVTLAEDEAPLLFDRVALDLALVEFCLAAKEVLPRGGAISLTTTATGLELAWPEGLDLPVAAIAACGETEQVHEGERVVLRLRLPPAA